MIIIIFKHQFFKIILLKQEKHVSGKYVFYNCQVQYIIFGVFSFVF